MKSAVIVDIVRTGAGKGKPGGALSGIHPVNLLAETLRALLERNDLDPATIDDVIAGCVSQAGEQALNIARNAILAAGIPESVPGTTVDRQCGSSQQAVHFAAQGVLAGAYDIVVACGVESMSRVPMGYSSVDQDPNRGPLSARYPEGLIGQGVSAELIAARWKLDREALDEYAARSHQRAAQVTEAGGFQREIVPITVDGHVHDTDQTLRASTTVEGLGGLKPSFVDDGLQQRFPEINWSITPGNSSPLTDAASAVLIMSEKKAGELGLTPRARFTDFAVTGSDPLLMLTGVIPATEKVLTRSGLSIDDIDAYEVNEAFAPVPLAWQQDLKADPEKLNPRGGAIALGHALGASGVRLLATLVNHLEDTGGRYGLQTMCEGGGMANATIIERV
ncbi:thiolase family protein [Gordonia terrae]|uniref:Acetyl-CoA C-acyltransferase n=2 Tax=Gordonia terrae TaxID=2055 RepID=A0AAD0KBB5_9ACTN|nr:thiolase family protein [Gordonia terrae]VTR10841.1 acetyl-CoA acetyltransferase ThlA [Clostridioides difficile]ANY24393.1 acetyl-CoA acetyltransferase [Gordonia terrae]AWO85140.1 acetyl-CoA C-acyltransferase [Gordonia terrae]VTS58769.1 3-ketoacyl-CoA thiolase [Gordonia terrae]GAB46771.1 putative acetyl-CoA acyltransferase [Gordonia terrae NBRC 100016]